MQESGIQARKEEVHLPTASEQKSKKSCDQKFQLELPAILNLVPTHICFVYYICVKWKWKITSHQEVHFKFDSFFSVFTFLLA